MKRKKRGLLLAALVLLMIISLATGAAAAEQPTRTNAAAEAEPLKNLFNDVKSTDNNALFINYLADLKIISGYPDGSYKAQEGLTRAQAAVILVKAAALETPAVSQSTFADVKSDHWAAPSIAAAAKAGYLKGYPDGSFKPEEKLTRAQGIALVMRLSKQTKKDELPALKDMPQNHWAAADMATALNAGMIGLSEDKTQVNPETVMTRGSLARALGTLLTKDPGLYSKTFSGTIKDIKGEIKLTRYGTTTVLRNGALIYKGDTITAGAGANANLAYPDGSSVLIKENTELQIKESLGRACIKTDGTSGIAVDNVNIELKKGTLLGALATRHEENTPEKQQAEAGETLLASMDGLGYIADTAKTPAWYQQAEAKKVKMKVDMPYGVAAVRGTFILVSVNLDANGNIIGCDVSCLTGDATVTGNNDKDGKNLSTNTGTTLTKGGNTTAATPITEDQKQKLAEAAVQKWVLNTALNMDQNQEAKLEMVVEIPDNATKPEEQAKNTLDAVLKALETSGIKLNEEVKKELENKLKAEQDKISEEAWKFLEDETPPPATQSTGPAPDGEGSTEESIVSYMNYAAAGTYGPESAANTQTISKNVIVSAPGITLRNMIITRDLTLGAGIGAGEATLINVKVQGNTKILGGGSNSVIIENCELTAMEINKKAVSVEATGSSFDRMNIAATAEEAVLELGSSNVKNLEVNAPAMITGTGTISNAQINAAGVEIQQAPINWSIASGLSARISGRWLTGSSRGNARLASLSLNGISVNSFAPDTLNYTASVANSVYQATLVAIPQESTASAAVNGVSKTDNSHILNLDAGANPINIVVTSLDGTTLEYQLNITRAFSSSKAITGFNFAGLNPVVSGCIDETAKTIALTVPYGTNITNLAPSITHTGTNITPNSGTAQDFSLPKGYTVTAADGSAQQYIVTVTESAPSSNKIITASTIGTLVNGSITGVAVPSGTKVSTLKAALTVSANATAEILAASGGAPVADQSNTNVTAAMVIQVTAQDGSKAEYSITFDQAINCLDDLNDIRNNLSGNYILARDLDFNDVASYVYAGNQSAWTTGAGWTPIGSFTGTFDGNGNAISNLYINSNNGNLGLFSEIGGTVKNLGLLKVSINTTGARVGAVSGYLGNGSILNCYSTGNISTGSHAGGIVGFGNTGSINGCCSSANVSGGYAVGGICGHCESNPVIEDCFATGNLSGIQQIGGIAGWAKYATISKSYATGNISGTDHDVGGLVGLLQGGSIQKSYALNSSVSITTGTAITIGRVAGNGSASACYGNSAMTITPTSHSGVDGTDISLTNAMQKSTYSSNYWSIDNTGSSTNTIWIINEGNSFPVLRLIGEIPFQ